MFLKAALLTFEPPLFRSRSMNTIPNDALLSDKAKLVSRAKITKIFFVVFILIYLVFAAFLMPIFGCGNISSDGGFNLSSGEIWYMAAFFLLFALVAVVQMVVYCMWLYTASKNKFNILPDGFIGDAAGKKQTFMMTPAWTVAWNFIPILNLFMPYIAMKQIWLVSNSKSYGESGARLGMLRLWWAAFILSNFTPPAVSACMMSVFMALSILIISEITKLQSALIDKIAAGGAEEPSAGGGGNPGGEGSASQYLN